MGLNIKDEEAVDLVSEVARRSGRTKTATIRDLARAELARLDAEADGRARDRARTLTKFFENEIWGEPQEPLAKSEIEAMLGLDEGADHPR
jgi:hypothetical protein